METNHFVHILAVILERRGGNGEKLIKFPFIDTILQPRKKKVELSSPNQGRARDQRCVGETGCRKLIYVESYAI